MSNETPENLPSTPPAEEVAGQHDFGPTASSEPVVSAAPAPPTPDAAALSGGHAFPAPSPSAQSPSAAAQNAPSPYGQSAYTPQGYPIGAHPAPAAPKKSGSKGLLWGIIGGAVALVLLLIAGIVVASALRTPSQTASGVLEEYLTALAEGDAETALTYIETYADDSLLTNEALAASLELAPITDIVVEESEEQGRDAETIVSASFAIGGETVERDFTIYAYDDQWQIFDGIVTATVGNFDGLGLTINGIEPGDTSVSLFPGAYQLALGYDEFALDSEDDTFIVVTDDDAEQFWDIYPVLTDEGAATFRSLVRASIEECVAMKTLATPCGMDISDIDLSGYTAVDGSVTRTITADGQATLDDMEVEVDFGAAGTVTTYDSIDVDTTLQGTKDGVTADFEVWFGGGTDYPSVDFTAEKPTVIWD